MYEVSQSGISGRLAEVSKLTVWEFFDILGYVRSQQEYRRLLNERK